MEIVIWMMHNHIGPLAGLGAALDGFLSTVERNGTGTVPERKRMVKERFRFPPRSNGTAKGTVPRLSNGLASNGKGTVAQPFHY